MCETRDPGWLNSVSSRHFFDRMYDSFSLERGSGGSLLFASLIPQCAGGESHFVVCCHIRFGRDEELCRSTALRHTSPATRIGDSKDSIGDE